MSFEPENLPRYIYTAQQIREIEKLFYQQKNLSAEILMERAAEEAFRYLQQRWPRLRNLVIFCGPRNNGGDGRAVARLAKQHGYQIQQWENNSQQNFVDLHIDSQTLIIDALFGSGLNKPVTGVYAEAIKLMNNSEAPILSLDVPSGLEADTGNVLGCAVNATATITFIGLKLGLLTHHGRAYSGDIVCESLGVPPEILAELPPLAERIMPDIVPTLLKPRRQDAHKGHFGHVLVIGGDDGMPGAVRMAGESALRAGAGLVTVATRPHHVTAVTSRHPEMMCYGVTDAYELEPLLARATAVILGPGLGRLTTWSQEIFAYVMHTADENLPMVVDADGLFWLSEYELARDNWVLTPHPGEAARLLQTTAEALQQHRLAALAMLQAQFGGVAVLKGSGSLIASTGRLPAVCTRGNAGMATGGMGDILSGVIGAFMAQGMMPEMAAKLGVWLHAAAADRAVADGFGERGLLATDLLGYIHQLVNFK